MPTHPSSVYLLLFETVKTKDAPLPPMIPICAHTKDLSTDVPYIGDLAFSHVYKDLSQTKHKAVFFHSLESDCGV